MENNVAVKFNTLNDNLQKIIKVYRGLLDVLRREGEILIEANLDDLNENNTAKEKLLVTASELEKERVKLTSELAKEADYKSSEPRLLDLAIHFGGDAGDKLRNQHSVLVLLLKRVKENNEKNDILVQAALVNVSGAINSIKDSVSEKATYERKGKVDVQKTTPSGQLVSREV